MNPRMVVLAAGPEAGLTLVDLAAGAGAQIANHDKDPMNPWMVVLVAGPEAGLTLVDLAAGAGAQIANHDKDPMNPRMVVLVAGPEAGLTLVDLAAGAGAQIAKHDKDPMNPRMGRLWHHRPTARSASRPRTAQPPNPDRDPSLRASGAQPPHACMTRDVMMPDVFGEWL
jgi:hypothetical protein